MHSSSIVSALVLISSCNSAFAFAPPHQSLVGHAKFSSPSSTRANQIILTFNNKSNSKHPLQNKQRTIRILSASSTSDEEKEAAAKKKAVQDEIFWAKQRAMAAEMEAKADSGLKAEQQEKFAKRRLALTYDTFYFSILIASLLWIVAPNPFVTISYLFGALSGTAYSYGLGKYVETIGGSIDDTEAEGAGVGQARFAFLILLFVVVGKFRSQGLLEIPSIMGFFTYQLASLGQGLREIDD